jgi:hypothetical protein
MYVHFDSDIGDYLEAQQLAPGDGIGDSLVTFRCDVAE